MLARLEADMTHDNIEMRLSLDTSDGAGLAWVYRHAEVMERRETGGNIILKLRLRPQDEARIQSQFPGQMKPYQKVAGDY